MRPLGVTLIRRLGLDWWSPRNSDRVGIRVAAGLRRKSMLLSLERPPSFLAGLGECPRRRPSNGLRSSTLIADSASSDEGLGAHSCHRSRCTWLRFDRGRFNPR